MSFGPFIMALIDPAQISISNTANWLYESVAQDDMDEHNANPFVAGDPQEEEVQEHEQFVAPPKDTTHPGVGSSYVTLDQWSWMQTEIDDLRAEQTPRASPSRESYGGYAHDDATFDVAISATSVNLKCCIFRHISEPM